MSRDASQHAITDAKGYGSTPPALLKPVALSTV
jgi:hypothetical protein